MKQFASYAPIAKAVEILFGIKKPFGACRALTLGLAATLFFAVGLNRAAASIDPLARPQDATLTSGGQVPQADIPCAFCVDQN